MFIPSFGTSVLFLLPLLLLVAAPLRLVHSQIAHGNGYAATPAPPTPVPVPGELSQDLFKPGVLFLDLVNVYGTAENPLLSRVNIARSGAPDLDSGRPGTLTMNLALDPLDLSAFTTKNVSKNSATAGVVTDVPIVDNAILMLYCDTSRYVDHLGIVREYVVPGASSSSSAGAGVPQQQQQPSFWGSNLCNTVNTYLKMPAMGASRVQWLFYETELQLATAAEVQNFTQLSRYYQATEWDLPQTFSAVKDLLRSQKYCRDVVDECVFHALSYSDTYQGTAVAKNSERLPVYNVGRSRYYPQRQFHNLWTAIESPLVAPAMPPGLSSPTSAGLTSNTGGDGTSGGDDGGDGGGGGGAAAAGYAGGPFGRRMSMHFPNLERSAWLMTVNRMPPLQLLTTDEARGPSDSATLLMQLEAVPSTLSPEGFYTGGVLLSTAAIVGICLFLVICKAIVPRILFLRDNARTGGEAALHRVDEELIAKFERERRLEEQRNATIAHLGRVTGAPLTPEDLEALEEFTELPVGDWILSAIIEERQREVKEQLATVTDKVAALPRVLFARALRLLDRSLFSTRHIEEEEAGTHGSANNNNSNGAGAVAGESAGGEGRSQGQNGQQSHEEPDAQDAEERREEMMERRRQQMLADAHQRRATELRNEEMKAQIQQVQEMLGRKQRELQERAAAAAAAAAASSADVTASAADPNRPSAVAAPGDGDAGGSGIDAAAGAADAESAASAVAEQQQRAAALLRAIENNEMGLADADLTAMMGETAVQVKEGVTSRVRGALTTVKEGLGLGGGSAAGSEQTANGMQRAASGSSGMMMMLQLTAPRLEADLHDHSHPHGPTDSEVLHSPIARQQREVLRRHGRVEVPASGAAGAPIVSVVANNAEPPPPQQQQPRVPPPLTLPGTPQRERVAEQQGEEEDESPRHNNQPEDAAAAADAAVPSAAVAAPNPQQQQQQQQPPSLESSGRSLPPLPPPHHSHQRSFSTLNGGATGGSASAFGLGTGSDSVPVVAYGVIPRSSSAPQLSALDERAASPAPGRGSSQQPQHGSVARRHAARYEEMLQRHMQEDKRAFDAHRDELLNLRFSVDAERAAALSGNSPLQKNVHERAAAAATAAAASSPPQSNNSHGFGAFTAAAWAIVASGRGSSAVGTRSSSPAGTMVATPRTHTRQPSTMNGGGMSPSTASLGGATTPLTPGTGALPPFTTATTAPATTVATTTGAAASDNMSSNSSIVGLGATSQSASQTLPPPNAVDVYVAGQYDAGGIPPAYHFSPTQAEGSNIPFDVPCCRSCGDVMPFVDLFAPCNCSKSEGRRYIHRRCLEGERRLNAFADGGRHAEYCWRCPHCRGRYTIAPNSISLWNSIQPKSPLAQTLQKLLNNPVVPLLALWVLVYISGYIVKFIAATMTLDYLGTDWGALGVYHWVLGAWFLLSFSLCERTLRTFFEIFEPTTRRVVIMVTAAAAPLLLGFIGHFVIVCLSPVSWSWESFYGLGVCVEAVLFLTVVPRLALFAARSAGWLYDNLPPSVQNLLQRLVP